MPVNITPPEATASIYRIGRESAGDTVYNYTTETQTSITKVFEEGDTVINNTNITNEAKQTQTPTFIPTTTLADGDYIRARFTVPDGLTLKVWQAGVHTQDWTAPDGLDCTIRIPNEPLRMLAQSTRNVGNPITSVDGPQDIAFEIGNFTGAEVNTSGYFSHTLEPTQ